MPAAEVVTDHSWGLVGTAVLELQLDGERFIAKAGDTKDRHISREIRAHREWLAPWTTRGRAPRLVHADEEAKLLVTRFLPGVLVQGTEQEWDPDIYRQAGELLAAFHAQVAVPDETHEARENRRSLAYLDKKHTIAPEVTARLRSEIESWPTAAAVLVPTHGDWQPRNWLIDEGTVGIIDFGRTDLRPAITDFARLAVQQFATNPALEPAFFDGYGSDPRGPAAWHRIQLREAINTTVWAHQVGDKPFEAQGHRMLAAALRE
ncbi:aminoglycoside phosphotransferase family protein [Kribbella capetownensis]|uniref:Aminoglycoside phosphotransferase family protein n=2 Tax=Kribbella capetownensis TaxID=1572659 RepID=A0A4R0JZV7_9ACTN|nr:aminoglycoside phosphotransferase family protein [Kribbella capetownensis]